ESPVQREVLSLFEQKPYWPGPTWAAKRTPKPCCGSAIHESKWLNGAGTGLSVSHTSGHAACVPCVSLLTSKPIVPVRPAKSNGCLGYIARTVTVPASNAPDALSLVASRSCPLQTTTSCGGTTVEVPLQPRSDVGGAAFAVPCPKLVSPRMRDTPQSWPFRSPERFPVPAGASNVSQNASGDVPNCKVQEPCAVAGPDSPHHAITPNVAVVIATTRTRLMMRRFHV